MAVGVRELKQNASAVLQRVALERRIVITDRGRPVAQLSALNGSAVDALTDAGLLRPASRSLASLPLPQPGSDISAVLTQIREQERY